MDSPRTIRGRTANGQIFELSQKRLFYIERFSNLKLVCVVTDKDIRYSRVAERPDRPFDAEAIKYRDISEIENLYKGGPIAFADYYILNNGTKEEVIERVKEILEKDV